MKSPERPHQGRTGDSLSNDGEASPPKLSILFITYRRVALLEQTHHVIMDLLGDLDFEIVVADDGSSPAEQDRIRGLAFDRYVLAAKNQGLGANNNAGLRACTGQYILMLQDDWEATNAFPAALRAATSVLDADNQVGMVRFAGGDPKDFVLQTRQVDGVDYHVCDHTIEGAVTDEHVYSDTPHLRRAILLEDGVLGPYRENCPMEESEEDYSQRFEAQGRFFVAFMDKNSMLFFKNIGAAESHRTRKIRYKIDYFIQKLATRVGLKKNSFLYSQLKGTWFSTRDFLIRVGLLK